jgi:hypothetical protein
MNGENINKSRTLRVLVAPLDWGLGHATRCIPIIRTLLHNNVVVVIAASDRVELLLQAEFPQLKILPLKGYNIIYSKRRSFFNLKIFSQIPKILYNIRHEKKWLNNIINTEQIDAVISDNRPGLFHQSIPSIYITHQLAIQTGNKNLNGLIQAMHYRYINRFDECWVPDNKKQISLGGKLSHPDIFPDTPVHYTGILSRFHKQPQENKYDLLLLISGPEPQRSKFEKLLLDHVKATPYTYALVRGLPGATEKEERNVFNHVDAGTLSILIQSSKIVIARCGYSTVMDLVKIDQDAILIPTPGQTEQEYLAEHLTKNKIFHCISEYDFSLERAMKELSDTKYSRKGIGTELNITVIENLIHTLRMKKDK